MTRTTTVENNQIVIRDGGVTVRYNLTLIRNYLKRLGDDVKRFEEYERLLTTDEPATSGEKGREG